jgi:hypothetical protein
MPTAYTVECFKGGVWDDQEPRDVDADNSKLAAEAVCGGSLRESGKPAELRAQVWPKGKAAENICSTPRVTSPKLLRGGADGLCV